MHNPEFIEGRLAARVNAVKSTYEAKNNRWHYQLFIDNSIGLDWLDEQIEKASEDLSVPLEAYKVDSSLGPTLRIEVRELERREGIDPNQQGLDAFEES